MQAIRGAIIDDCSFALKVKKSGYRTWIGLTHSVRSVRLYKDLSEIWNMVARTAFTQLFYSITLLIGVSLLMIVAYWVPVIGLFDNSLEVVFGSVTAWVLMLLTYIPILRFYSMPLIWSIFLPVIGTLFLCMTWTSALRYWRGERSRWKDRVYTDV